MTVATLDSPRPPTARPRALALALLCGASLLVILDTTIVSVALPSIRADLGFSASGLAWVVNAYLIPFGGLLLLAGRLGDLVGRKAVFLAGLAVFLLGSLLCGLAADRGALVAARIVQGVGGALATAVTLGLIAALFPERRERTRAIAVYGAIGAVGASAGTVLGGVLTEALSWHWIFIVNLPIGVPVALGAAAVLASDDGAGLRRGADGTGAGLLVGALLLAVAATVGAAGRPAAATAGLLAAAAALGGALWWREQRATTPLLPPALLRSRTLRAANAIQVAMIAGFFGQQFILALYLQRVMGDDVLAAGLSMLPVALAVGAVSLGLAARAMARLGSRRTLLIGLGAAAGGLLALARAPADATYGLDLLPALLLLGAGAGLALPAVTAVAMAEATAADAGLASGLINTTQQVGAAIGLAVLTAVAEARTASLGRAGRPTLEALAGGYRVAFAVAAGLVLLAAGLAAAALRGGPSEAS